MEDKSSDESNRPTSDVEEMLIDGFVHPFGDETSPHVNVVTQKEFFVISSTGYVGTWIPNSPYPTSVDALIKVMGKEADHPRHGMHTAYFCFYKTRHPSYLNKVILRDKSLWVYLPYSDLALTRDLLTKNLFTRVSWCEFDDGTEKAGIGHHL
jgi:hypothetical protein